MIFLVVRFLLVPSVPAAERALEVLSHVEPTLLALGVLLEALSLATYSVLTSVVLPREGRPAFSWLFRTDLSALSVAHVTPAGAATSNVVRVGLLHRGGVRVEEAVAAVAVQGFGSAATLQLILGVAALTGVLLGVAPGLYAGVAVAVLCVLMAELAVVRAVEHHPDGLPAAAERITRWSSSRWRARLQGWVRPTMVRVVDLLSERRLLGRFAVWGSLNWCLDAAALWVFLAAFGVRPNPVALCVAYGVANVMAGVPIAPGGLGVVEAGVISVLTGLGEPSGPVVLGVVAWRLLQFWLPIPVGAACYASLVVSSRAGRRPRIGGAEAPPVTLGAHRQG